MYSWSCRIYKINIELIYISICEWSKESNEVDYLAKFLVFICVGVGNFVYSRL